jgi:hypothetical protein
VYAMAPTTAEVRTAAKMPPTMAATTEMCTMTTTMMTTTMMATAVATTAMTATLRGGIPTGGRQYGREKNDGNPDIEF